MPAWLEGLKIVLHESCVVDQQAPLMAKQSAWFAVAGLDDFASNRLLDWPSIDHLITIMVRIISN